MQLLSDEPIREISRVRRSKQRARANYNRLSRWYDFLFGWSEDKYRQAGLQMLKAQPGERIMEIGVGTGRAVLSLARAVGESGRVYGIDISEHMLDVTRERLWRANLGNRVQLLAGDFSTMTIDAGGFDAVFMSFVLELFDTPEIPAVLDRSAELLRAGGRICVVALSKADQPGRAVSLYEIGHRLFPAFLDCRPIYAAHSLAQAGFQILESKRESMWGLPVEIILAQRDS